MKVLRIALIVMIILISGCSKNEEPAVCDTNESGLNAENNALVDAPEQKEDVKEEPKLIIIHNGRGVMCISELRFLNDAKKICPPLVIEEHNTDYSATSKVMGQLLSKFPKSEGVSESFEYLPFTFVNDKAYSGFDDQIRQDMREDIEEICR